MKCQLIVIYGSGYTGFPVSLEVPMGPSTWLAFLFCVLIGRIWWGWQQAHFFDQLPWRDRQRAIAQAVFRAGGG